MAAAAAALTVRAHVCVCVCVWRGVTRALHSLLLYASPICITHRTSLAVHAASANPHVGAVLQHHGVLAMVVLLRPLVHKVFVRSGQAFYREAEGTEVIDAWECACVHNQINRTTTRVSTDVCR